MSHPVADLRKRGIALRVALEACLIKPKPEPVHKLRTHIRRIQAQLQLIPRLSASPKITTQSKRFLKAAKSIRRAAGKVRDVDVHIIHLANLAKETGNKALTETLIETLDRERDSQADKLQHFLHKHRTKLFTALDNLETVLSPARNLALDSTEADRLAYRWFADATATLNRSEPAQLHDLRKAAKLARYIAEAAATPTSSPTAHHFNKIQQSIGEWHDWLTLTNFARQHLAPSNPLLSVLKQHRDRFQRTALTVARTKLPLPGKIPETVLGAKSILQSRSNYINHRK